MNQKRISPQSVRRIKRILGILLAVAIMAFLYWIVWRTYQANNLGFEKKTLWDWMQLLVVPIILALLVFLLNKSQKDTELHIAEMRRTEEREMAEQRAKVDKEIEKDRQQQEALEIYLDRMTDLLLKNRLRESTPSDEIRSIARTRTLTILRGLDGARKSQLIQFLYEASLIGKLTEQGLLEPILDLSFADLQNVELKFGKLDGINLSKANLRNADFEMASLIGANFYNADLNDSNFSWTKLMGANLHAGLKRVNLSSAKLDKANLEDADLSGAQLWHTSFKNANLQYTNFMFKDQFWHNESNLEPATLMNVDFSGADLKNALISSKQLLGAQSLSGAILPNGQVFDEWKKTHSLKDDGNFEADTIDTLDYQKENNNNIM